MPTLALRLPCEGACVVVATVMWTRGHACANPAVCLCGAGCVHGSHAADDARELQTTVVRLVATGSLTRCVGVRVRVCSFAFVITCHILQCFA